MLLGQSIILNASLRIKLATWACKVAIVGGHEPSRTHSLSTPGDRKWVREQIEPPKRWTVYAGAHDVLQWKDLGYAQHYLGHVPFRDVPVKCYSESTTLGVGHAIFFVFMSTDDHSIRTWQDFDSAGLRRLWPITDADIFWPPMNLLDSWLIELIGRLQTGAINHPFNPDAHIARTV